MSWLFSSELEPDDLHDEYGDTQSKDAEERSRTPRRLPNIWPDLRPKPAPRMMTDDEEHMFELSERFNIGDRVIVNTIGSFGERKAEVKFVGKVPPVCNLPGYWVGVQYDEMVGKNDGSIKGERIFKCAADYGGFVRPNFCKIDTRPPPGAAAAIAAREAATKAEVSKILAPPTRKKRGKKGDSPLGGSGAAAQSSDAQPASAPAPATEPAAEVAEGEDTAWVTSSEGEQLGSGDRAESSAPASAEAAPLPDRRRSKGSRKGAKGAVTAAAAAEDADADADLEALDDVASPVERPPANPRDAWAEELPPATRQMAIEHLAKLHKLTLTEASKKFDATFALRRQWETPGDAVARERNRAAAEASSAYGPGLSTSIVRQLGIFTIITRDENGNPRTTGGEPVAVAVRGTSNVRARLTDNQDGTYTCKYRAWVSGVYSISIWLHGEPLGSTPYTMHVLSTRADATKCELRGAGLKSAVSREPASFEVEFVDAFGQVCYAEELDVYVELVYSPRLGMVGNPKASGVESGYLTREPGASPVLPAMDAEARKREFKRKQSVGVFPSAPPVHTQGTDLAISLLPPERRPAGWEPPSDGVLVPTAEEDAAALAAGTVAPPEAVAPSPSKSKAAAPLDPSASAAPSVPAASAPAAASAELPVEPAAQLTLESFLAQGGGESFPPEGLKAKRLSLLPQKIDLALLQPSEYVRLDAVERQLHMQLWARRRATDQAKLLLLGGSGSGFGDSHHGGRKRRDYEHRFDDERSNELERKRRARERELAAADSSAASLSYQHELRGDRKGFGFAYGGVSPGTLHAKGQLVRVHTCHYSVGLAGKYRLHVGLRQQSVALPGSPFDLEVTPGTAYAPSTRLPQEQLPLRGVVGDKWRGMVIFAADKIGNQCVKGGAKVKIAVDSDHVEATYTDNNDGSYAFQWRSQKSGTYSVIVTIDGMPVVGSPTTLTMLAAGLDVNNCEASGDGLTKAIAGEPAVLRVQIKDEYKNSATPSTALQFVLSLQPGESNTDAREKRKKSMVAVQAELEMFSTRQAEQMRERQRLEQKQQAAQAAQRAAAEKPAEVGGGPKSKKNAQKGEDEAKLERRKRMQVEIPAMPFDGHWVDGEYEIRYTAQKAGDYLLHLWADPEGAGVREILPGSPFEVQVVEASPSPASSTIGYPQDEKKTISAGEKLQLKPQLRDQFGNPSAAPPDALTALLEAPDGPQEIEVRPSQRGLGAYEITHDSVLKGEYTVHVELNGQPIAGSPGIFHVHPAAPVAIKSILKPPAEPPVTHQLCELELIAIDKLGNALEKGGAKIDARVLGANATPCAFADRKDGTYSISFTTGAAGEYKVIARMDNVELPPLALQFAEGANPRHAHQSTSAGQKDDDVSAKRSKSGGGSKSGGKGAKKGESSEGSIEADSRDTTPAAARAGEEAPASMSEGGAIKAQGSIVSAQGSGGAIKAQGSFVSAQGSFVSAQGSLASGAGSSLPSAHSQASQPSDASSKKSALGAKKGPTKPLAVGKAIASKGGGDESQRGGVETSRVAAAGSKGAETNRSAGASTTRGAAGSKDKAKAAADAKPKPKGVKFDGAKATTSGKAA